MFDKKLYQETISQLHASEEILTEVKSMTYKHKKHRRLSRIIPLAAALTVLFCMAAAAAYGLVRYQDPTAMIRAFFGENVSSGQGVVEYDEQGRLITNLPAWERVPVDETLAEKLIAPYIFEVNETAVWEDYTLCVEAVLYDAGTGAGLIYYTVENPNGVDGYEVFVDGALWWPAQSPVFTRLQGPDCCYIDTAMITQTKLYLCSYFITGDTADSVNIGIGPGADRIQVNDITLDLPTSSLADLTLAGGAVTVSPISIQLDRETLGLPTDNDPDRIVLRYADGSEYVVEDEDSFVSNHTYALSDGTLITYTFNRIVDTHSVTAVEINGALYQ